MRDLRKGLSLIHFIWSAIIFAFAMLITSPFIIAGKFFLGGKRNQDAAFLFLRFWAILFSIGSLIFYKIINRSVVKKDKAYIFIANHSSYLDSVAVVLAIPQSFKPLGKVEMTRVPVFGSVYRKIAIMIDRRSKVSREKSVVALRNELAQGQSILIFPEGTMNQSDKLLNDFYDGAFHIAIESQTPILPLVIKNSRNLLPRNNALGIKPGVVTCKFLDEISVKDTSIDGLQMLKSKVHQLMYDELSSKL